MAQLVAHLHGMERVRGSNPLSSTGRVSGDFQKPFFHIQNPKSKPASQFRQSLEKTGRSQAPHSPKNLHRVEESSHQQASQHPKTSSHWRKLDATKHLTVQIPPVTGTYDPLRHLQSPYYSSAWKNHPAERPLQKDVSGGACVTA